MKELIAYCGIDCEKCDARIATVNNDDALREKTAKLWSELNHCEIPKETLYCMGCRTEGVKTYFCDSLCEIRKCAEGRKCETCGSCGEIEKCEKVKPILDYHAEAKKNLLG